MLAKNMLAVELHMQIARGWVGEGWGVLGGLGGFWRGGGVMPQVDYRHGL